MREPAFEFLRQFKNVSAETETLVIKTVKRKFGQITPSELYNIFELGISGEYGKIYTLDPQTLLDWVEKYLSKRTNVTNYLDKPLLPPDTDINSAAYYQSTEMWHREVNKAYTSFLNGTTVTNFHPHIYDRLMVDNKIPMNQYLSFMHSNTDVNAAKQQALKVYFEEQRKKSFTYIYSVQ